MALALLLAVGLILIVVAVGHGPKSPSAVPPTTTLVATSSTTQVAAPPAYQPPPVTPVISPALAGEGQWVAADTWNPGPPSVLTTTFRPDPAEPSIVAYAAWIRTSSTLLALYPGYKGPGPTTLDRGPEMVPPAAYPDLLATFNSGFYESDEAAGFYTNGTLYDPMVPGLATVVEWSDGAVDIVDWQGGPAPGPGSSWPARTWPCWSMGAPYRLRPRSAATGA